MASIGDLFDTSGGIGDGHQDYTSQDTVICLEFEDKHYKHVKINRRINQSCKRKRAIPVKK